RLGRGSPSIGALVEVRRSTCPNLGSSLARTHAKRGGTGDFGNHKHRVHRPAENCGSILSRHECSAWWHRLESTKSRALPEIRLRSAKDSEDRPLRWYRPARGRRIFANSIP